jgi:hypothetical protein
MDGDSLLADPTTLNLIEYRLLVTNELFDKFDVLLSGAPVQYSSNRENLIIERIFEFFSYGHGGTVSVPPQIRRSCLKGSYKRYMKETGRI